MTHDEISTLIVDESNDIVYLVDAQTYELVYVNRAAVALLNLGEDRSAWLGQPCYRVLQQLEEPCAFCTNHLLSTERFYTWEFHNDRLGRVFSNKDKLVYLHDRLCRLELSSDITEKYRANEQLKQQLVEEETLVACIRTLNDHGDAKQAIDRLLEIICKYYEAERTYIFEYDAESALFSHTYEWCAPGAASQIERLQELPLKVVENWLALLKSSGEMFLSSADDGLAQGSLARELLSERGIAAVMAAPLAAGEQMVGLVGVDNPQANLGSMTLLRSMGSFIVNDINKRKLMEQLMRLSYTDDLTHLGNRHSFMNMLNRLEENAPAMLGIVYVDINGLKIANDTYGHHYGDHIIRHTADTLMRIFPHSAYRVGGDEFVVLCPNLPKGDFASRVAALREAAQEDDDLHISIGASWHVEPTDIARQISHADDLMYIEKQQYYGRRLDNPGGYFANLSTELIKEIAEGAFLVYLQPKIDLQTGVLSGAEALVRHCNEHGVIESPGKFIPRYETEGIIRHLDFFVLETICEMLKSWQQQGLQMFPISINLSRLTMLEHDIVPKLLAVCERYGVLPRLINIEVTESIGLMETQELQELIHSLHEAGFSISLDDFGSEYSNMSLLTSLQFDEVKLDRSLISHLDSNNKSRIVTTHVIQMCQDLDFSQSVAEGIETADQHSMLAQMNCTVGQGYYFDKPMPLEAFMAKYMTAQPN